MDKLASIEVFPRLQLQLDMTKNEGKKMTPHLESEAEQSDLRLFLRCVHFVSVVFISTMLIHEQQIIFFKPESLFVPI